MKKIALVMIGISSLLAACGQGIAPDQNGFFQEPDGAVPPQGHDTLNPTTDPNHPLNGQWDITVSRSQCNGSTPSLWTGASYSFNGTNSVGYYTIHIGTSLHKRVQFTFRVTQSSTPAAVTASSPPSTGAVTINGFQTMECSKDPAGKTGYSPANCPAGGVNIPASNSVTFSYTLSTPTMLTPRVPTGVTPSTATAGASAMGYSLLVLASQGSTDRVSCNYGVPFTSTLFLQ